MPLSSCLKHEVKQATPLRDTDSDWHHEAYE
jgi:hypothetical protein